MPMPRDVYTGGQTATALQLCAAAFSRNPYSLDLGGQRIKGGVAAAVSYLRDIAAPAFLAAGGDQARLAEEAISLAARCFGLASSGPEEEALKLLAACNLKVDLA